MENILFIGFALSFFTLVFTHIYFTNAFFLRLQKAHEDVWKELGEPRWKIHFGDDSFKNAMKYIRNRGFKDLKDSILEDISRKIKRVEYISIVLAIVIIAATIVDVLLEEM